MKKEAILSAALKEFGKSDYDQASVNNIIKESQTSKGTFYHYFKDKESLYLEVASKVAAEKIKFLKENTKEVNSGASIQSIFDVLKLQIKASLEFSISFPDYANFSIMAARETNLFIRNRLSHLVGTSTKDYYRRLIEGELERGTFCKELPKHFIIGILPFMIANFTDFLLDSEIELSLENREIIFYFLEKYIIFVEKGLT